MTRIELPCRHSLVWDHPYGKPIAQLTTPSGRKALVLSKREEILAIRGAYESGVYVLIHGKDPKEQAQAIFVSAAEIVKAAEVVMFQGKEGT